MKNFKFSSIISGRCVAFRQCLWYLKDKKQLLCFSVKYKKTIVVEEIVYNPGLQFKVLFLFFSQVRRIDARIQTLDGAPDRFVTE